MSSYRQTLAFNPCERKPADLDYQRTDITLDRAVIAGNPQEAKRMLEQIEVKLALARERGDSGAVARFEQLIAQLDTIVHERPADLGVK